MSTATITTDTALVQKDPLDPGGDLRDVHSDEEDFQDSIDVDPIPPSTENTQKITPNTKFQWNESGKYYKKIIPSKPNNASLFPKQKPNIIQQTPTINKIEPKWKKNQSSNPLSNPKSPNSFIESLSQSNHCDDLMHGSMAWPM